jgi:hypothetical protein
MIHHVGHDQHTENPILLWLFLMTVVIELLVRPFSINEKQKRSGKNTIDSHIASCSAFADEKNDESVSYRGRILKT